MRPKELCGEKRVQQNALASKRDRLLRKLLHVAQHHVVVLVKGDQIAKAARVEVLRE